MSKFALCTGRVVNPLDLKEEDISLDVIAHHLTNINRFGGGLPLDVNYSVAEHSMNLARQFDTREEKRYALIHDASEAYLGDIISGLKDGLEEYKKIESHVMGLILKKYDIEVVEEVHVVDKRILLDEVKAIRPEHYDIYKECVPLEPMGGLISFNKPRHAVRRMLLMTFNKHGIVEPRRLT